GVGEQEGRGTPGRAGADDDDGLAVRGVVVIHGRGPFCGLCHGGLGGRRRPAADGQGESGDRVAHAVRVGAGHGEDQPSVFVRGGDQGAGLVCGGQRIGDGAGGGVRGQRGLELLAYRGERDGVDRVDAL